MAGISHLQVLLSSLQPTLEAEEYVFCTVPGASYGSFAAYQPLACFLEEEGLTVILPRQKANALSPPDAGVFRRITLCVHSSLEAVGLTAAVATCLAERGISANMVAAYYHDHIFVPSGHAESAVEALRQLSAEAAAAE